MYEKSCVYSSKAVVMHDYSKNTREFIKKTDLVTSLRLCLHRISLYIVNIYYSK